MRVLLIEDDPFLHDTYASILNRAGLTVISAHEAQEAVDKLDEHGADVIILDLMLPGHNGVEVLQELQSHSDWQNIPVLVLSAQKPELLEPLMPQLKAAGVRGYLYKPEVAPGRLVELVRDLVAP